MRRPLAGPCAIAACLALSWAGLAVAENWPQWRGPSNDGVSRETNLPAEWEPGKNIAWKLPLPGMGGSTPAIWGDRIFLTSEDGKDIVLLCVSTEGKELWKRPLGSGRQRFRNDEGNAASASPSTDGKHVWAFAGTGDLACFDLDGKEVWHLNTQDRYGRFVTLHGLHTSPLLYGDHLYLQLLHSNGAWVVALDRTNGKEVWKVERKSDGRGECKDSYASPCVWSNGPARARLPAADRAPLNEAYLITHGSDYTIAHRLSDGSEIWRLGDLNNKEHYNEWFRLVASPVATPDLIVVPTAKGGPVIGLKPNATGLVRAGSPFEQWRMPRDTPDVSSPLVKDGLVYLCRENGTLICLDAKTGKVKYSQRIHAGRYRASPVWADGKVYLTARDGTVTVVQAGPTFKVVSVNRLADQVSASPAISGGRLYFRGFDALYAIGIRH